MVKKEANCFDVMKSFCPESDFIALLVKQDRQAYNDLYDNYSASLYGIVLKIVKNENIAQDLLQDIFIKIRKNCEYYDADKGRFFTWILHIARKTCFDYLRKQDPENLGLSTVGDEVEGNQAIFPNMKNNDLKELISQLKKAQKIFVEMFYCEGDTHPGTAYFLKTRLGTVKMRMQDALKKIRFILANSLLNISFPESMLQGKRAHTG